MMLLLASPVAARATEGLTRPCSGELLLRFGSTYSLVGKNVVHRGLDIQAEEGDGVLAAAGGTVSFAGQVPADGGGRVTAVTVTTDTGLLVCVSPLRSASVSKGDYVSAGELVGVLAGSGDDSVADTHVHLSVRDEGVYVDPELLLGKPVAIVGIDPEPGEQIAADRSVPDAIPSGSAIPAVVGSGVSSSAGLSAKSGVVTVAAGSTISGQASSVLGPQIAESVQGSFSAEIARLRMRHGIVHTAGFAEPRMADVVAAAVMRPSAVAPVSAAGLGLLIAASGCLAAIGKLRQESAALPVLWRER